MARNGSIDRMMLLWCGLVVMILMPYRSNAFTPIHRHTINLPRILTKTYEPLLIPSKVIGNVPQRSKSVRQLAIPNLDTSALLSTTFLNTGPVPFIQALSINIILFTLARQKLLSALTPSGYIHAMILGTMLWTTLGWTGWLYCVLYLVFGQMVTKIGYKDKEQRGIAESRGGRRGPENVWGSAATSLLCAILTTKQSPTLSFHRNLFLLGYVAALATKLADTFASEIGKAYGKTTFLITTFERVKPGTEGAISVEGTMAAMVGGFLLSICGYFLGLINLKSVVVSTIAAFIATNAESLIGATIQGKKGFSFMTNEVVNFLNTFIGGSIAMLAGKLLLGMA